jgi:DNA-binding response OmpR family regulator
MAKVLLVDDDTDILNIVRVLLVSAGHEVTPCQNALVALQTLQTKEVHLLITDANMPGHSGFDLIRAMKRVPRAEKTPVVMLTGRRERKDIELAIELGVQDYIVKPIDPLLFLQKIKDLTENQLTKPKEDELPFASAVIAQAARATVDIEIHSVSEIGLVLRSSQPFQVGAKIAIDADLFKKIGIETPAMKIISCEPSGDNFETRVNFIGTKESQLTKIRAWVHASVVRRTRSAA